MRPQNPDQAKAAMTVPQKPVTQVKDPNPQAKRIGRKPIVTTDKKPRDLSKSNSIKRPKEIQYAKISLV